MSESDYERNEDLFSKSVRAGKRTYFFDVRSTKANDYYLTITESKKRFVGEGQKAFFEKHKIFLYKEDFEKFMDGLNEALTAIRTNNVAPVIEPISNHENVSNEVENETENNSGQSDFSNINFDDLK